MAKLNLSSPWVIYYRQINAMFDKDPEINVVFDENNTEINIFVENVDKADALEQLLPVKKEFGNVVLRINVIPANKVGESKADLFRRAFEGNEALSFINTVDIGGVFRNTYIVFKKEVVQYFTDDLSDVYGVHSGLYQDIAKEIFGTQQGIYFCTDVK